MINSQRILVMTLTEWTLEKINFPLWKFLFLSRNNCLVFFHFFLFFLILFHCITPFLSFVKMKKCKTRETGETQ